MNRTIDTSTRWASRAWKTVLLGAALAPLALAGGGEKFCSGSTLVVERWPSVPPAGLPWAVSAGVGGLFIGPGLPPVTCSQGSGLADYELPGVQSLLEARNAISDVPVPGNPSAEMSTFALEAMPNFIGFNLAQLNSCRVFPAAAPDGVNLISMWEPDSCFALLGAGGALAVTGVALGSGGDIVEADIALNARSLDAGGRTFWSFVELNAAYGSWFATTGADVTAPGAHAPLFGYADIRGVTVHELGHLAGLAHSLVDSRANPSGALFPTMFPYAQVEPFQESATVIHSAPCTTFSVQLDGDATQLRGVLGRSAATLEADDAAALGRLYPTTEFGSQLGTISGQVVLGSGASQTSVSGAHVVAIHRDSPDVIRVGELTYADGLYELSGLPPGDYYVLVEPVDQGPAGSGAYFDEQVVPNYVTLVPGWGGCVPNPLFFLPELWDSQELTDPFDFKDFRAETVQVAAGQVVGGVDIRVQTWSGPVLWADLVPYSSSTASLRGLSITPVAGAPTPQFELRLESYGAIPDGSPAFFIIDIKRQNTPVFGGQLAQLPLPTGSGLPLMLSATVQGGSASAVLSATPDLGYYNWFVQGAMYGDFYGQGSSTWHLSNALNVWISNP